MLAWVGCACTLHGIVASSLVCLVSRGMVWEGGSWRCWGLDLIINPRFTGETRLDLPKIKFAQAEQIILYCLCHHTVLSYLCGIRLGARQRPMFPIDHPSPRDHPSAQSTHRAEILQVQKEEEKLRRNTPSPPLPLAVDEGEEGRGNQTLHSSHIMTLKTNQPSNQ